MIREFVADLVGSVFANALTPKVMPVAPQNDAFKLAWRRLDAAIDGWRWYHKCTYDLLPSGWTASAVGLASSGSVPSGSSRVTLVE